MKRHALLFWIASLSVARVAAAVPKCGSDEFLRYLEKNDQNQIKACLSGSENWLQLCNVTLITGTILELPLKALIQWRLACKPQPVFKVSGTMRTGSGGRVNVEGLAAEQLPPGQYIAEINVTKPSQGQLRRTWGGDGDGGDGSGGFSRGQRITAKTPHGGESQSKNADVKEPNGFDAGLADACPVGNPNMNSCFRQGFNNARSRFKKMEPLSFQMNLTGGSVNVGWAVDGLRVYGISNYTVRRVTAKSTNSSRRNPLSITTEWITERWRVELNVSYSLTVITNTVEIKLIAQVALDIPNVVMYNGLDVWGERKNNEGVVRFYAEDKLFKLKFDVSRVKIFVDIATIPGLASIPAMNELVRLHFKHVALDVMWPRINKRLGSVFQQVVNGEVVPVVIGFLLTRGATPGPRNPPKRSGSSRISQG